MPKCLGCGILKSENQFLREQNKTLTNSLTAVADARAYEAVKFDRSDSTSFYGSSPDDEYVVFSETGQRVLVKKDVEIK